MVILLVLAAICFLLGAIGYPAAPPDRRVNIVALGLLFGDLYFLVPALR